ncbi:hypothetical protein GCM10009654_07000 [Streptomyces hebeiensis]|uniref:Solute-binding protein family 5 domain-containing protein n=1 Tax=Streptomyces hebeiensis TaxID=229486 RepID=A0ABN1UL99_9ACTN
MTVRRIRAAAAAAAILTGVAACSVPGGGARGGSENGGAGGGGAAGAVVIGVAAEPDTLSPLLGYGKDGNSKIFDGLLTRDAGMKLRPALAKALPTVSDDGLTYTYTLRDGVKFSDGEPLTSADVVLTYETILDAKTNNASRSELDAIEEVRADGDDTVVFTLKYPYTPFAGRTVLPVVPEHIVGGQDANTGSFNTEPIGTGPYVLESWSKGEKLTFNANPDYWGGAPKVKKVTMAIIEDDDVRATRLRSGDLDGALLPPNLAATFENDRARKTYSAKTYDSRMVTLPTRHKVTGDRAVLRRPHPRPPGPPPPRGQRRPAPARLPRPRPRPASAPADLRRDDRDARRVHHGRAGTGRRGLPRRHRRRAARRGPRPHTPGTLVRPHGSLGRRRHRAAVRRYAPSRAMADGLRGLSTRSA